MTATRALPGADLCVHCGFCLQACPTYLALDDENDSPRGRIVLMKALADGSLATGEPDTSRHLDQCLGCRACETACPSGVPYGQLLEATRAAQATARPLPALSRLILFVFARPALLQLAMLGARMVRATRLSRALSRLPGRVAVLTGCVMEGLLSPVNRATELALAHNGYTLVRAPAQRCCGALHAHAGARNAAQALARANIAAFDASGADAIAVNSAGCGAAMKDYGHLLADDPAWHDRARAFAARVRDVSELLAEAGPRVPLADRAPRMRVAVDHPCHLVHGQRLTSPPAKVLDAMSGVEAVELPDAATCCGSAGLYSLSQPQLAASILAPKLAAISATGADTVVTGNPGCLMHIGAGLIRSGSRAVTRHPVELLADAYATEDGRP